MESRESLEKKHKYCMHFGGRHRSLFRNSEEMAVGILVQANNLGKVWKGDWCKEIEEPGLLLFKRREFGNSPFQYSNSMWDCWNSLQPALSSKTEPCQRSYWGSHSHKWLENSRIEVVPGGSPPPHLWAHTTLHDFTINLQNVSLTDNSLLLYSGTMINYVHHKILVWYINL